jgi:hypothetical protein
MLLDPFLYDFATEHQRALRETTKGASRGGERGPGWWRLPLGMAVAVESRRAPSVASRRLVCHRRLACRHAAHAFGGPDV